jgi:hypothetical protein
MPGQLQITFPPVPQAGATVDPEPLVAFLTGRGWVRAAQIEEATGWPERDIRAMAEAADGQVVSGPGSPGYALWTEATIEQIVAVDAAMASQIKRMTARRVALHRRLQTRLNAS